MLELAPRIEKLDVPVVIDHFARVTSAEGIRSPGFARMIDLMRTRSDVWVKSSSFYRVSQAGHPYEDMRPMAEATIEARPERLLRDIEELIAERGIEVDHTTVHRWIVKYSPVLMQSLRTRKRRVGPSWRMDETYIKVRGSWCYLFRAVDRDGDTIDFYFAQQRNEQAARRFLERAIDHNGIPARINIDGSAANRAAILYVNKRIEHAPVRIRQIRYLNNIVE
jgi:DDE domain/Amidohydrolase